MGGWERDRPAGDKRLEEKPSPWSWPQLPILIWSDAAHKMLGVSGGVWRPLKELFGVWLRGVKWRQHHGCEHQRGGADKHVTPWMVQESQHKLWILMVVQLFWIKFNLFSQRWGSWQCGQLKSRLYMANHKATEVSKSDCYRCTCMRCYLKYYRI